MADKRRSFREPSLQRIYDTLRELSCDPASELYRPDGSQRTGANIRVAYWRGFNDPKRPNPWPRNVMLHAAFAAGVDDARVKARSHEKR